MKLEDGAGFDWNATIARNCAVEARAGKTNTPKSDQKLTSNFNLQIKPVQKQTRAGQRTRFKAIVLIGDSEGHIGLGIKTSKEVATAIRAAITIAKLAVLPVRRGYWGTNLGEPHSLPVKQSGKCGSVSVRVSFVQWFGPCFQGSVDLKRRFLMNYSSFPPPAVPALSLPPLSSVCSSSPVSRTLTPPLPAPPRPSRTPSRPPSSLSSTPTVSLPPTCGPRTSSSAALWRSSVMSSARARSTRLWMMHDFCSTIPMGFF